MIRAFFALLLLLPACVDRKVPARALAPDAAAAALAPSGEVGLGECDEYLVKMTRCMGQLSPEAQDAMRPAIDDARRTWRAAAATASGRAQLRPTCQKAVEAARSAAQAMGCEW